MEALLSATDGLIVRREDRATTSTEGFIALMGELWKGLGLLKGLGSFDEM